MNPALSVILLTTLIGAAQGLFLALFGCELLGASAAEGGGGSSFLAVGGALAVLLSAAGLGASFAHLGHPERAWRAAAMWRTSWLSREVIALPLFMALVALWALLHFRADAGVSSTAGTVAVGALAALAAAALFVCTAMIYASIRFLQEWASAYTLVNYTLLGLASGATLAAALAAWGAPALAPGLAVAALGLTLVGGVSRWLSLQRNAQLKPKSTVQSAIGVRHPHVRQRAMGFMGGSFNTREFFHGRSPGALRQVKLWFLIGAFAVPAALLVLALASQAPGWIALAFAVQFPGLLAERWFFFAQANHPQNLYYQAVS